MSKLVPCHQLLGNKHELKTGTEQNMRQMARDEQKKISPYSFPEVSITDATLRRIFHNIRLT
jgi:hypothetical protein